MKLSIKILPVLIVFTILIGSVNAYYQIQDTETRYWCSGTFKTGNLCALSVDEDFNTYAEVNEPGTTKYVYEDFLIPPGVNSSVIKAKTFTDNGGVTIFGECYSGTWTALYSNYGISTRVNNITIPAVCLNYNSTLQIRTGISVSSKAGKYYESSMNWSIPNVRVSLNSPSNSSKLMSGNNYFSAGLYGNSSYDLVNATLYVWFLNGTLVGTNFTTSPTGSYTFTNNSLYLSKIDDYKWNYKTCGASGTTVLCNFADNNRTFDLNIYRIDSVTYNSTTYETSRQVFQLGLTILSGYTLSSGIFSYAGTNYTSTKSCSGQVCTLTNTLNIPVGSGSKSFKWYPVISSTTYQIVSYTQTVSAINFGICNNTLTVPYLNLTFKDEADESVLNASVNSMTISYWIGNGEVYKYKLYSNTTANDYYQFCFSPGTKSVNHNISLQYSSSEYPSRRWFYDTLLTNSTYSKVLYLLGSAYGTYSVYQAQTADGSPIAGVVVTAERQISGSWTVVEQGTTDSAGTVTFWLNPNYDHRLTLTKSGYTSAQVTIRPSSSTYTITMATSSDSASYSSNIEGVKYRISPQIGKLTKDTNYLFWFNVTSTTNDLVNCRIRLLDEDGNVLNSSTESAGSTTSCNISVNLYTDSDKVFGEYSLDFGSGYVIIDDDAYWFFTKDFDTGGGIWKSLWYMKDIEQFGDETIRQEYSRIVLFFLIFVLAYSVMSFSTGWDFSTRGGATTFMFFTLIIVSAPGWLKLSGLTPFDQLDKWAVAIMFGFYTFGYWINNFQGNN